MSIIIKRLNKELIEDYLNFFDTTLHSTGLEEHRCYCVCWTSTIADYIGCKTAKKRRELAKIYIEKDFIQGYLAYKDNKVIGWCNANTKKNCINCISWQMFMKEIKEDNLKVKSVFCFEIAPEYRGKGIATALLKRVCEDALQEEFDYVEAYPNLKFIDTEQDFMGPLSMYEKCGFTRIYDLEKENKTIMRKKLK